MPRPYSTADVRDTLRVIGAGLDALYHDIYCDDGRLRPGVPDRVHELTADLRQVAAKLQLEVGPRPTGAHVGTESRLPPKAGVAVERPRLHLVTTEVKS